MNGLGAACYVLPVCRYVNTERRAGEIDRTDQVYITIEDHYFRPVMELGPPGSESHHCAVIVRFRANGRSLILAGAGNGVGTDHLRTRDIEQDDFAREPVRIIHGKRTDGGAVARDDGRPAEPVIGLTEVNHSLVRGPIKLIDI